MWTLSDTERDALMLSLKVSLWGVGLSALLIRNAEGMGRRVAIGALLVVAGGVVIGATR